MSFLDGLSPAAETKTYERYTPTPFRAGMPAPSRWSTRRAISEGFEASTWAYRCITMTMESGSTVPFYLQQRGDDGKWAFVPDHPLSTLLQIWNDDMNGDECIALLLSYLLIGGNALVGLFPHWQRPRELIVESPSGVAPVPNGIGGIGRYEYYDQGTRKYWDADDVAHGRLPNPANRFWGQSRLIAIARAIDSDSAAVDWNKARLEQGGVPDGIIIDRTITTQEQRTAAQDAINDGWRDARGPWVQGDGVEWVTMGLSPKDMEFLRGRTFSMREICIGFGYNPALWGEDATYSNSEIAEKQKWTGAILPLLNILGGMLTRGLIPRERRMRERIWYDTAGVEALQENLADKVKTLQVLVATGCPYDTAKDALQLPLPDLPNGQGKVPLIDGRYLTLKSLIEGETGVGDDELLGEDELADAVAAADDAVAAAADAAGEN